MSKKKQEVMTMDTLLAIISTVNPNTQVPRDDESGFSTLTKKQQTKLLKYDSQIQKILNKMLLIDEDNEFILDVVWATRHALEYIEE